MGRNQQLADVGGVRILRERVLEFSSGALKAVGAVELLAAVGLILPAVLPIAPVLVPLAARRSLTPGRR
jgi:hypothetical protein